MMRRVKHILSLLAIMLIAGSCDKVNLHVNYVTGPTLTLNVSCELNDSDPEFFVEVECDAENGTSYIVRALNAQPQNTRFNEDVMYRYIIDIYRANDADSKFVERRIFYADPEDKVIPPAQFNVEPATYKVLVWCDFVRASAPEESWYFNTDDIRQIVYTDVEVKDNNDRDCYTNAADVDLTAYSSVLTGVFDVEQHLVLERPCGRYRCVTTDVGEYTTGGDYEEVTCVLTYQMYVARGYNVEEQRPNDFDEVRTYISTVSTKDVDHEGNLELCYDYVFVNGKQTNVKVYMELYRGRVVMRDDKLVREDGTPVDALDMISTWSDIAIPLKRNMETLVVGRMLTSSFDKGGIGIAPDFEDEIVINWPSE